ncbi:MAG: hypothetical protein JNM17_17350, partial [Archangium sp.]|nr:hypothetical protein [Archangium sp.]
GTADTVLPTDAGTTDALLSTAGSSSTSFEIAALGGTALGPTASFTGRGQASVALAFTRFGVSLDVGLESARTRTVAPVTVTSTSQWASLNGLIHFRPLDRLRLSLSLGVRLWRIAAETTGADANATTALASFGGVAATTATIRLIGPLSAQLSLYASSRWRAERFNVSNLGPVLELLPWEGGLLGGLVLEANFL